MIRHTFIATIKEGADQTRLEEIMELMRGMENQVPQIKAIAVGKALGYLGADNVVNMVVDFDTKEDFDAFVVSEPHQAVSARAGEVFQLDNFVINQIEFEG